MNIGYLIDVSTDNFTGGGQAHLANLIREMQVRNSKLKVKSYSSRNPNKLSRLLWILYVMPQVIIHHYFRRQFDLIHAHSIPAMVSGKSLSLILGIPIVVTIHGAWMKSWLERFILTKIRYDAQITVSRDFLKVANVNKNVVCIPNGVDIQLFKGPTLALKGRTLSDKKVLFVGRKNDPAKGFRILSEAMKLVKQEHPEAKLIVADGYVSQTKVIEMYQRASLFVLPSLSEGFPLTLLEAWSAKLPVIATRVGELSYLVKNNVNGYLIEPGDAAALAKTITNALSYKHLAKLGANGYNLAKRYTWEETARATLKVYQKIYWRS